MKEFISTQRYSLKEAENEAFWLNCVVDSELATSYDEAEKIWCSDSILEPTEENKVFWSKVVEIYNIRSNEHREEIEQREIDLYGTGIDCDHNHTQNNPELKDENMHHCFACQQQLIPVFPDMFKKGSTQYQGALIVGVGGGYGADIDTTWFQRYDQSEVAEKIRNTTEGERTQKGELDPFCVIICHDCANDLREKVPWIGQWLKPYL